MKTTMILLTATLLLATPGALAIGAAGIDLDAKTDVNVDASGAIDQAAALRGEATSTAAQAQTDAQAHAEAAKQQGESAAAHAVGMLHEAAARLSDLAQGFAARVHVSASISGLFGL